MSGDILSCPFCRSLESHIYEHTDPDGYLVTFVGCECGVNGEWFLSSDNKAEERAWKAWNTRPQDKLKTAVEALEKCLEWGGCTVRNIARQALTAIGGQDEGSV